MNPWFLVVVLGATVIALACAYAELWRDHQALQAKSQHLECTYAELREDYQALQAKSREEAEPSPVPTPHASPKRQDFSKRECRDRLSQLGFWSLEEYYDSERWREKKQEYRKSD